MTQPFSDRTLTTVALSVLAMGCLWVLQPFITALLWAAILATTSWPAFRLLDKALKHKRLLSASVMTTLISLAVLVPVISVFFALSDDVSQVGQSVYSVFKEGLPDPPAWVAQIPLLGSTLHDYWQQFAHDGQRFVKELEKWAQPAQQWALAAGQMFARGIVELALSVFLAFFFFLNGETLSSHLAVALQRISGPRAHYLLTLTRNTVTGVIYGVLGTALAQGVLAGLGFLMAGVPGAILLGAATFFLSVIPIGPPLVWGGATVWLFQQNQPGWAVFMFCWGFFGISMVDNIIKPLLISRGSQLPFAVVFLGVLGGVLAFGVIGAFLGPALLAVGFRLTAEWTSLQASQTASTDA